MISYTEFSRFRLTKNNGRIEIVQTIFLIVDCIQISSHHWAKIVNVASATWYEHMSLRPLSETICKNKHSPLELWILFDCKHSYREAAANRADPGEWRNIVLLIKWHSVRFYSFESRRMRGTAGANWLTDCYSIVARIEINWRLMRM